MAEYSRRHTSAHPRLVARLPLDGLWDEHGIDIAARHLGVVDEDDVRDRLRGGLVRFVIADGGHQLEWIELKRCFEVWKREVRSHLVHAPNEPFRLDDYPGGYCYLAAEWQLATGEVVIVLQKYH